MEKLSEDYTLESTKIGDNLGRTKYGSLWEKQFQSFKLHYRALDVTKNTKIHKLLLHNGTTSFTSKKTWAVNYLPPRPSL